MRKPPRRDERKLSAVGTDIKDRPIVVVQWRLIVLDGRSDPVEKRPPVLRHSEQRVKFGHAAQLPFKQTSQLFTCAAVENSG